MIGAKRDYGRVVWYPLIWMVEVAGPGLLAPFRHPSAMADAARVLAPPSATAAIPPRRPEPLARWLPDRAIRLRSRFG